MKIIEIITENFETSKVDLIELNDQFLTKLNISKERTIQQKEAILKNIKKTVGMTYFNRGTDYSCGGDYVWMNSIYVKPAEQRKDTVWH